MPSTLSVLISPANDRVLDISKSLADWLASILPSIEFRVLDRKADLGKQISMSQFCLLVMLRGTRGSQNFFVELGRLEQALGAGNLGFLALGTDTQRGLPQAVTSLLPFFPNEHSMLELCFTVANIVSPVAVTDLESRFQETWPQFNALLIQLDPAHDEQPVSRADIGFSGHAVTTGQQLDRAIKFEPAIDSILHLGSLWSMGVPGDDAERIRYLPMSLYLSSLPEPSEADLLGLLRALLAIWDLEVLIQLPTKRGSWIKSWWIRTRRPLSLKKIGELLTGMVHQFKQAALDKMRADATLKDAQAIAHLMQCVGGHDFSTFRLGSVLMIKNPDGQVLATSLTNEQMAMLSRQPQLLETRNSVLAAIAAPEMQKALDLGDSQSEMNDDDNSNDG